MPEIIVYIGAGWDLLILDDAVMDWGYDTLVCVDPQPALKYYKPENYGYRNGHSLDAMMAAVRRRLDWLGCEVTEEAEPEYNLHTFRCSGALDATVEYFHSTRDTEMLDNPVLASRLADASGLIVKGYQPSPKVLVPDVLPMVREVYLTEYNHCRTLPMARIAIKDGLSDDREAELGLELDMPWHSVCPCCGVTM